MLSRSSEYPSYVKVCYDHSLAQGSSEPVVQFAPFDCRPHNALVPPERRTYTTYKEYTSLRNFPSSMLGTTTLPATFFTDFSLVPSLNRLLAGRTSASALVVHLGLPSIDLALLDEALAAPSSACGWDYQRLEHIGDAPLKLFTSVHVYLEHPRADEERLTRMRENSVDNRSLRLRALESGLARHILPHTLRTSTFMPETADATVVVAEDGLTMTKKVSRRLLCDTVEATLGAALLTGSVATTTASGEPALRIVPGGFDRVLAAGDRLGLCFGGPTPWHERASARELLDGVEPQRAGVAFRQLEAALGYEVKTQGKLLVQALTHRSWVGEGTFCYEREEFLGDALLDTVRFPSSSATIECLADAVFCPTTVGDDPPRRALPPRDPSHPDLPARAPRLERDARGPRRAQARAAQDRAALFARARGRHEGRGGPGGGVRVEGRRGRGLDVLVVAAEGAPAPHRSPLNALAWAHSAGRRPPDTTGPRRCRRVSPRRHLPRQFLLARPRLCRPRPPLR